MSDYFLKSISVGGDQVSIIGLPAGILICLGTIIIFLFVLSNLKNLTRENANQSKFLAIGFILGSFGGVLIGLDTLIFQLFITQDTNMLLGYNSVFSGTSVMIISGICLIYLLIGLFNKSES